MRGEFYDVAALSSRYIFLILIYLILYRTIKGMRMEYAIAALGMASPKIEPIYGVLKVVECLGDCPNMFAGMELGLKEWNTIGRSSDNTITIDHAEVSRQHAVVYIKDKHVYIRDLKSKNGTFVNGKRIRKAIILREGDMIEIGPITFLACRIMFNKSRGAR